jgi:hypothetical protein
LEGRFGEGGVQCGLDGSFGAAHHNGNLGDSELSDVAQQQRLTLAVGNAFEEGGDHHPVLNVTLTRLGVGLADEESLLGVVTDATTMKVTTFVESYNHRPTLWVV